MLHNKYTYVIVVPDICCFKNFTTCTCFFLWSAVRLDPCHHSDTVSKFIVSQWEHTSEKYIAIHMLPNFAPLITFLAQHIIVLYSLDKLKILDNI